MIHHGNRNPSDLELLVILSLSLFFVAFSPPGPSEATVLYVDGSRLFSGDGTRWDQAFKTIEEGVNAATSFQGDEVWVRKGTYAISSTIVIDNKDIGIYGGFSG